VALAPSRTSPKPYTPWLVSRRMIGHGLGPGFTTVATRISVIFNAEGAECVFTALGYASAGWFSRSPPPIASAEVFMTSRRLKPFRLPIRICPSYWESWLRQSRSIELIQSRKLYIASFRRKPQSLMLEMLIYALPVDLTLSLAESRIGDHLPVFGERDIS